MSSDPQKIVHRVAIVCWVMFALHAVITGLLLVGIVMELTHSTSSTLIVTSSYDAGRNLGRALAAPMLLFLNGVFGLWANANARGLRDRKRWAYSSSVAYFAINALCLCIPMSVYGLWSLTRPGVADFLRRTGTA